MEVVNSKNSSQNFTIPENVSSIYDLKVFLSGEISEPVSNIHIFYIYIDKKKYLQMNDCIFDFIKLKFMIAKSKCAMCLSKSAAIIGDCKFCQSKYCLNHRLPEAHDCVNVSSCKKEAFKTNEKNLLNNKCVSLKLEKI